MDGNWIIRGCTYPVLYPVQGAWEPRGRYSRAFLVTIPHRIIVLAPVSIVIRLTLVRPTQHSSVVESLVGRAHEACTADATPVCCSHTIQLRI
jgi:hypothetical protein